VPAVRLIRPDRASIAPVKSFEESAWESVEEAVWRTTWDAEVATADPWVRRDLALVCGLLLPIWSSLPRGSSFVRRLKAPDGRRWLGRLIEAAQVPQLKMALGISDAATAFGDAGKTADLVLQQGAEIALAGGLWLRRAKVMDRYRLEVVGAAPQRATFNNLGCFTEVINYAPRVFVPIEQEGVLKAILAKFPPQSMLPKAA
jgi:hypothetical protein